MSNQSLATWMLEQEARALLTRLARLKPYSVNMPMAPAAAISPAAQVAIEKHMSNARRRLRAMVNGFIGWLRHGDGRNASPAETQRRFSILKLQFNNVITQFDIFADVLTQRSEHETGVWIAGLDDAAADALELPGGYYKAPPVICYLDRGHGAAIRRARTRLPGGDECPVSVIRVPRERMIGSGIASSLIHEVGHQGAALLDLVNSFRPELQRMQHRGGPEQTAWMLWERWVSEIIADFWSVAKLGIAATLGLIGVVSLPRAFVFRIDIEDPHPAPWVRVMLSCALGSVLYPHPQWSQLAKLWTSYYPLDGLEEERRRLIALLQSTMPQFVSLLTNHRPRALRGRAVREALALEDRTPARLLSYFRSWSSSPAQMRAAPPTLAFAVLGQARASGMLTPELESEKFAQLLTYWAVTSAICPAHLASRLRGSRPCITQSSHKRISMSQEREEL